MFFYLHICLYIYPPINLSTLPPTCLFISQSVYSCLDLSLSLSLVISLSIFIFLFESAICVTFLMDAPSISSQVCSVTSPADKQDGGAPASPYHDNIPQFYRHANHHFIPLFRHFSDQKSTSNTR